ncbi:purine and uridine phosphorylase [Aureobasidium pullulans]|nr:purine and uridine phosphorylase [Aureobasidium pullulans]
MILTLDSYQVGWICALSVEADLAELMLDKIHNAIPLPAGDQNVYTFGQIDVNGQGGSHNVVIARLPAAETGTAAAATVAKDMLRTFKNLKFGLMVGIAGGIWSPEVDVRLGDVVVGVPDDNGPGVVQYDHGKYIQGKEFVHRGILDKAPKVLRTAVSVAKQVRRRKAFLSHLDDDDVKELAPRPTDDILFEAAYAHPDGARSCAGCEVQRKKERPERRDLVPLVHYGAIASGNGVVKDALFADDVRRKHGILCFEMEAAGLDNFPCLVIRGISDYADTHKNDEWHAYAASTAAAYAKELLKVVPLTAISQLPSIGNKHWLVPRPSTARFTGRESVLQKMKDHLVRRSDDNRERPTFVCCGMGGSGKSETAIKFVENNRESFWGIFWVNADTQDTAKHGFAKIASACSISSTSIEDVKSWLANEVSPWLLVLDNCDSMGKDYSWYLPSGQNGSIIMTTRLPECKVYGLSDDMDKLGPEASSSLLLRACGDKYQDRERHKDAAANVVKLVDELAIALVHAGAYIRRGFCTLQEFPQRFHTQKEHIILFKLNQMASRYGSVYTTFEISAEALSASGDKYDRLALTLLKILAFLDHEGVEEDIFKRALEYYQVLNQNLDTRPHVFEELQEADTNVPCDVQPSQLVLEEHEPAHGARVKISVPREMNYLFQNEPRSSTAVVPTENPFIATVDEEPATGQMSCPVSVSETPSLSINETSRHDADDGEIYHLSRWHCEEFRSTHLFDSNTLSDIEISRVRLADLSLIRVNNDKAISMHPLVHEWASIRLSAEERKQAWGQTVCVLALSAEGRGNWQTFTMSLKAHIEACFKDRKNIGYDDEIPLDLARCLSGVFSNLTQLQFVTSIFYFVRQGVS